MASLLAAYDFGASAKQLQAIYDREQEGLDPVHLADRKTKTVEEQHVEITTKNWTEFLGQEKCVRLSSFSEYPTNRCLAPSRYYANYLAFFSNIISELGAGETLEQYVFSPTANGNDANMLLRFVGGA